MTDVSAKMNTVSTAMIFLENLTFENVYKIISKKTNVILLSNK